MRTGLFGRVTGPGAARGATGCFRTASAAALALAALAAVPALSFGQETRPVGAVRAESIDLVPDRSGVSARDVDPAASRDLEPPAVALPTLPATPARPAESRRPLMQLLDQAGVGQTLDDARVRVYGHAEGGYTFNFNDPFNDINAGRVFDVEHDELLLNQLTLNVERPVIVSGTEFDLGGRMEWMYGSDARFIHANGLLDHHEDDETSGVAGGPENQFDLVQLYADVNLPVGNGLRIRAGKFTYFKQIDPNASVFYSHSYTFGAALPFTLTGAYATYKFSDRLTADFGASRGWDQSLEDNNGAIDVFGRVKYNFDERTSAALAFITGPEQDGDNDNYRTALNLTASHQATDDLLLLADITYGQQANADFVTIIPGTLGGAGGRARNPGNARWYGASVYAIQRLTDQFSVAGRLEYYRDEHGFTTALPQTLWEATVGLIITPFPNDPYGQFLKIRPEIRYDYSNKEFFDGFTSDDQFTAAVDVIFNF